MADDNLARNRNDAPDFFADGDPLAELARIVGYDERLVPKAPVAERREPAFNLEDELLREFERYEAPRPHQPELVAEGVAPEIDAFQGAATADLDIELSDDAFDVSRRSELSDDVAGSGRASPIAVEAALHRDHESLLAQGQEEAEHSSAAEQEIQAPEGQAQWEREPVSAVTGAGNPVDAELVSAYAPDGEDGAPVVDWVQGDEPPPPLDLSDELELALGAGEAPAFGADVRRERKPIYTPTFRMPLANFHPTVEPQGAVAAPQEPRMLDRSDFASLVADAPPAVSSSDQADQVDPAAIDPLPDEQAVADLEVPVSLDFTSRSHPDDFGGDALVPEASTEPVAAEPSMRNVRPDSFFAVESKDPVVSEPRFELPVALEGDPFELNASGPSPDATVAAATPAEPISDDEFELALDDLELDLTDILLEEHRASGTEQPPVAAPPAVASLAQPEPTRVTASWSPIARVVPTMAVTPAPGAVPAQVQLPAEAAAAPSWSTSEQPGSRVVDAEQSGSLAFDPALIADTEDQPEPVVGLDVPDLSLEEQEAAPEYRSDDDYDIDAELASLLQPAALGLADQADDAEQVASAQPQQQPISPGYLDLDDFERALEEDFRRSLTTPLPQQSRLDPNMAYNAQTSGDGSRRSFAALALPLAIAGVVVAGGSIAYALFGGENSSIASSGEPIIIAADTDPVKVLPKDPGGKTVPNQDKAVYDRVAGQVPEAPKQEALISTNEEPVDVVQKTLMTDQLPLEGEEVADAGDVVSSGVAQEDRLMPNGDEATMPAETAQQPVAIMPRRVKTMVVRPDGTLVEQEVATAPAPMLPEAMPGDAQKAPAASVKSVEVASIPDTPAAPSTAAPVGQGGIVPVSADASATTPEPVAGVDATVPEATAQAAIAAPVPIARPAQQAANVVAAVSDQGRVQAAPAAPVDAPAAGAVAPVAPTEVASVSPGGYVIQIASLPTAADAEKSYKNLSAKFGSVIGGRGVDIREAVIAGKGTFYRVRIPAGSKADAVALCESYRAAGGSCLVAK
ncbi:SPOR domain-containing protein [Rhizobium halophilum]|uniref:SPOR domain-containing protein n=1 Tax=Rhizobium halophilum TaxID=2846852 RepID=UPI001EFE48F2|nr:SPOR domain-containing protein [Rhizobium halophilum]MCF6370718.1 SPOR domain-containing protein [Rhizobium halophilum]